MIFPEKSWWPVSCLECASKCIFYVRLYVRTNEYEELDDALNASLKSYSEDWRTKRLIYIKCKKCLHVLPMSLLVYLRPDPDTSNRMSIIYSTHRSGLTIWRDDPARDPDHDPNPRSRYENSKITRCLPSKILVWE